MNIPTLPPEDLSDLEDQFLLEYSESIEKFEFSMTELYKAGQYQSFLEVAEQAKAFFLSLGPGGAEYYKNTWEGDPRLARAKSNIAVRAKYPDGALLDDVCSEIMQYIHENEQIYASEVFKRFSAFPREHLTKALEKLCKGKQITKGYDDGGRKVYALP